MFQTMFPIRRYISQDTFSFETFNDSVKQYIQHTLIIENADPGKNSESNELV